MSIYVYDHGIRIYTSGERMLLFVRTYLFTRIPNSRLTHFKMIICLTDSDGDKIAITRPSDFALFLEQNINKIFVEATEDTVFTSLNSSFLNTVPSAPTYPAPFANIESSSSAVTDDIRKIRHEGILCDVCDKEVFGFRFKCLDCEEFDMCMDCAPKQIHLEHLVLRIANPIEGEKHFHLHVTDEPQN